jgi:ankyrin repeat protein
MRLLFMALFAVAAIIIGGPWMMAARYPLTPLASAARIGDVAGIDRLIADGADVNAGSGVNNWPPLMHAIHKGQPAAIARLIEAGASVEGGLGRQALLMASGYGDATTVSLLLARGVDPRTDGEGGAHVLAAAVGGSWDLDYHWSGCEGHTAVVRSLLGRDARLRLGSMPDAIAARLYAKSQGCTALLQLVGS